MSDIPSFATLKLFSNGYRKLSNVKWNFKIYDSLILFVVYKDEQNDNIG